MRSEFYSSIESELSKRKDKNLFRKLKSPLGIDFCSNDYLGLSKDTRIMDALMEGIRKYGAGSTASRLVRGHRDIFEELEDSFTRLVGGEGALFVANGFTANIGLLDTIADSRTHIFTDRLNHASILDGIRLADAKKVYYKHLDMEDLRRQLEKYKSAPKKILVSETVFSMDGDTLPLAEFIQLAEEFDAITVLDETHAVGVFGVDGGGISCMSEAIQSGLQSRIDFRVYTLGKALGLEGGMVVFGRPESKDFCINSMRNFIFSTAPMPAIAHAGLMACQILRTEPERVANVLKNAEFFRDRIQDLPIPGSQSTSQIVPILLPSEEIALQVAKEIQESGMDVRAIRPPTVPSSRIRVSIHSDHSWNDLEYLALAFRSALRDS